MRNIHLYLIFGKMIDEATVLEVGKPQYKKISDIDNKKRSEKESDFLSE